MYKMTTSKCHFEQLLPKMYANNICRNNQKVCIDCLKPISNKNKFKNVKIVVALTFMWLIIKILYLKYYPVCNV